MGMFDSVYVPCPRCGTQCEFQTKAGECFMDNYTLDTAPPHLLFDIMNMPRWCAGCKSWFALIDPKYPPGMPPRPDLSAASVREPVEGEFSVYRNDPDRFRWWLADFTFDDLVSGKDSAQ